MSTKSMLMYVKCILWFIELGTPLINYHRYYIYLYLSVFCYFYCEICRNICKTRNNTLEFYIEILNMLKSTLSLIVLLFLFMQQLNSSSAKILHRKWDV